MKKPINIIKDYYAPAPNDYEGYLYCYTNLKTNQKYIGIHKGSVTDVYNHSSKNNEFQEVFVDSTAELKFEVLEYGSYFEMQNIEHKMLSEVDAKNSDDYYNKHNGFAAYPEANLERCLELLERIESGEFRTDKYESLDLHKDMKRMQVRTEDDPALQKEIRQKIDDEKGKTDNCNPILVFECRGENGEDMRGDGNHTVAGAVASKHALNIPVDRVPYEVHKDYSEADLKGVCNLCNKKPGIVKKPISIEDGIKHVVDNHTEKSVHDSINNVKFLKAYGFNGSAKTGQINTILKNAKKEIDDLEYAKKNILFINYGAAPHNKTLTNTVEAQHNTNTIAMYMSSAKVAANTILEKLLAAEQVGKKRLVVIVHHKSRAYKEAWQMNIQPYWMQILKTTCPTFEIVFEEMPTTMPDGTK